ncbi:inosine monophosphate dehydrogenase [Annulohypoxylon bovei var. microspora]|nr:inosine monophosphate dehydrogenase [Annulohypoxylon bovei var. microspora]
MSSKLRADYPWVSSPIIINAPMEASAGDELATAVSKAGGIGMIGSAVNMADLEAKLERAQSSFASHPTFSSRSTLPLGVDLLPFVSKMDKAMPILAKYKPAILWLFAAKEPEDYGTWARVVRQQCPETKIWVQVGSATAALQAAKACSPDVLVLQGADAGGHGVERGAGIVSLLPQAADMLQAEGFGDIPLVAAGGIADGRGVAAALALGAAGAVMGTRFLAATEAAVHPQYRAAMLGAKDGALDTVRSKVFDLLQGPSVWPAMYDGRALATDSYADSVNGVGIEKIRELHSRAIADEDSGFGKNPRAAVWAGASVGIINDVKPAAKIVDEVRDAAISILSCLSAPEST